MIRRINTVIFQKWTLLDTFTLKKPIFEGVGKSNLPLQYTSITSRLKKPQQGFTKETSKPFTSKRKLSTPKRVTEKSWANFMEDSDYSTDGKSSNQNFSTITL